MIRTSFEPGLWRAWLSFGTIEVSWPRAPVAIDVSMFGNDDGKTSALHLRLGIGVAQAFIPICTVHRFHPFGDEPGWGFAFYRDHAAFYFGTRRKLFEWPFRQLTLEYDDETADGWAPVGCSLADHGRPEVKAEDHPYTYRLRDGGVQHRTARISRRRRLIGRHLLHRIGWPTRMEYELEVNFDDEVGERTGSWKGGTIGCGWDIRPGETPLAALRRMERDREFD